MAQFNSNTLVTKLRYLEKRKLFLSTSDSATRTNSTVRQSIANKRALQVRLSSSSNNKIKDEKVEDESIEGVWIFHRHGDRSPSLPICSPNRIKNEAAFWQTKLPQMDFYQELNRKFPVKIHDSEQDYFDSKRAPFGCLTQIGCKQMEEVGRSMAFRYNLKHDLNINSSSCLSTGEGKLRNTAAANKSLTNAKNARIASSKFVNKWDVKVYSTQYKRTVTSAQCFLTGLLLNAPFCSKGNSHVQVEVRDRQEDILNAFDSNPQLMHELVNHVISSDAFQTHDALARPLALKLSKHLPGLKATTTACKSTFISPSGINWIHASDHFVCRSAHKIPYSAEFDDFGNLISNSMTATANADTTNVQIDEFNERALCALARPTIAHLSWRFSQWYKSPPLLSAISAPPLLDILSQILYSSTTSSSSLTTSNKKKPFQIFSCHDVTILSLLHGINADIIHENLFWPAYATTLTFELVRKQQTKQKPTLCVRVLLNDVEITMHNKKTLSIAEFDDMVRQLESHCHLFQDQRRTKNSSSSSSAKIHLQHSHSRKLQDINNMAG